MAQGRLRHADGGGLVGPDDWIADHPDWHPRIQGGKTVDILHGDGQRILSECLERTAWLTPDAEPLVAEVRRYGAPRTVQQRLAQGTFRVAVTGAYGACAVSGEHSLPALEATHVRPYAQGGEHALANGMLLRADIHRLYDAGYATQAPDYRFRVSGHLIDDFHNGREYERYAGRSIVLPRAALDRPSPERLEWHGTEVFRG